MLLISLNNLHVKYFRKISRCIDKRLPWLNIIPPAKSNRIKFEILLMVHANIGIYTIKFEEKNMKKFASENKVFQYFDNVHRRRIY